MSPQVTPVRSPQTASPAAGEGNGVPPESVTAVVLTYRRPRLAGDVVRSLLGEEGLRPDQVIVVVNGDGGLDDPDLEAVVRIVRLPVNTGPAGGFRAGLEVATADPTCGWIYLCEDDVGLFDLPSPRLAGLLARIDAVSPGHPALGAVVAYGRNFVGRGAHTVNVVPATAAFAPVDVACWGATLVARRVIDDGVLPDPDLFFGVEDFDFFCRVRDAGWEVLVDGEAARAVAGQQTNEGRDLAISADRPNDAAEAWRAYYHARNSLELARRHGRPSWFAWHLAYSVRHLQVARSRAERSAIAHGLWDGIRGRLGQHPAYSRDAGEHAAAATPVRSADPDGS
jgi:GT2 family glycosyltransferase